MRTKSQEIVQQCFRRGLAPLSAAILLVGCGDKDATVNGVMPDPSDFGSQPADTSAGAQSKGIAVGDRLEVFVDEDPTFNAIYPVRESGDIIIPKIGRIAVVGMTPKASESRIASALEAAGQLANASVIVDRLVSTKRTQPVDETISIYLSGKVVNSGMHRIPKRQTGAVGVYEALLIAGGLSKFGDDRDGKIHISRLMPDGKRTKIPLNYRAISSGETADVPIREGDIIHVPERVFGF